MIEKDLIIDYQMVRGMPGDVEVRVQQLLEYRDGWVPKGDPLVMKIDGCEVLVQCMVQLK